MYVKTGLALYKKTALSFGGLFSAFECFFAVFLFTYLRMLVPAYAAALIAGITMTVSVVLMPLAHSLINRIRSVLLGRYHGALIVATLLSSLLLCLLFTIPPDASMAYKASIATVALLFLSFSIQIFSYCVFSITVRVTDHGDRLVPLLQSTVSLLSAAVVIVLTLFYFDYTAAGIAKIAYIVSIFILAAGCSVYFSTYTVIPKLIKTEPRAFRVKAEYARFFRLKKAAAFACAGRYLSMTAMLTVCLSVVPVVALWQLPGEGLCAALASAAFGAAALRFVFFRGPAEPSHYRIFSLVGALVFIGGVAVATLLPLWITLPTLYAYLALCGCACLCGAGYALVGTAYTGYMEHTYSISGVTRGTYKCLKGMLTTAAVATAVVILSVFDIVSGSTVLAVGIAGTVAVCCIAGAALSVKGEQLGNVQKS